MSGSGTRGSLLDALGQEHEAMQSLVALLRREQHALVAGDADGIAAALPAKTALLARLAGLGERRAALLRIRGGATAPGAIGPGLADDVEVMAAWQALLAATREAWRHNVINGSLVSERLLANQNALAAISPPGRGLYGRHGRSVGNWDSRGLGAA